MSAATILPAIPQFFDDNGLILSGGLLYSFEAGTSTPQACYTTSTLTPGTEFSNPIQLDAAGRPSGPIYLLTSPAYKFELHDANDVPVGPTYDQIIANAPAS